jgi:hypothetical protein
LTVNDEKGQFCFFSAKKAVERNISPPEFKFNVIGPKEAFVESIDHNLNLIRKMNQQSSQQKLSKNLPSFSRTQNIIIIAIIIDF